MNISIKIGIRSPFWPPRRFRRQRKVLGMSPEQYRRRFKAAGLPFDENFGEPQNGPKLVRRSA
jgi:hypothetical protein